MGVLPRASKKKNILILLDIVSTVSTEKCINHVWQLLILNKIIDFLIFFASILFQKCSNSVIIISITYWEQYIIFWSPPPSISSAELLVLISLYNNNTNVDIILATFLCVFTRMHCYKYWQFELLTSLGKLAAKFSSLINFKKLNKISFFHRFLTNFYRVVDRMFLLLNRHCICLL
jgi:hypothetical protein